MKNSRKRKRKKGKINQIKRQKISHDKEIKKKGRKKEKKSNLNFTRVTRSKTVQIKKMQGELEPFTPKKFQRKLSTSKKGTNNEPIEISDSSEDEVEEVEEVEEEVEEEEEKEEEEEEDTAIKNLLIHEIFPESKSSIVSAFKEPEEPIFSESKEEVKEQEIFFDIDNDTTEKKLSIERVKKRKRKNQQKSNVSNLFILLIIVIGFLVSFSNRIEDSSFIQPQKITEILRNPSSIFRREEEVAVPDYDPKSYFKFYSPSNLLYPNSSPVVLL